MQVARITNFEHSPIRCAFGLCDRIGTPKFVSGQMFRKEERR